MPVPSLRRRQIAIVALLFVGYASLYFCRADLSVATPLLIDELRARGMSQPEALLRIGTITSLGTAGYAVGKLFLGGLGDFWGGRINFLIGLAGATVFTVLFAVTGLIPLFTLAWVGNRRSPVDGHAHPPWIRLACPVLFRRRSGRRVPGHQLSVPA